MRIQLSALFGAFALIATSVPLSAAPLSWAQSQTCTLQGEAWDIPPMWKATAPAPAQSLMERLASPTSHWRFADQALTRVSHSPVSGIALNATFDATHDFILTGHGRAKPLYVWGGCRKRFAVRAGRSAFVPSPGGADPREVKDQPSPYITVSRPRSSPVFPAPPRPKGGGVGAPTALPVPPAGAPLILVMDVNDKKDLDPATPATPKTAPGAVTSPAVTPVPLPPSLALLCCAVAALAFWTRRRG